MNSFLVRDRSPRHVRYWLASLLLTATTSCIGATDPDDGPVPIRQVTVFATSTFTFSPSEAQVSVGGKVVFRSGSPILHNITPVGHELWEPVETDGQVGPVLEVTFDTPGSYEYYCTYHGPIGMTGVIRVIE